MNIKTKIPHQLSTDHIHVDEYDPDPNAIAEINHSSGFIKIVSAKEAAQLTKKIARKDKRQRKHMGRRWLRRTEKQKITEYDQT